MASTSIPAAVFEANDAANRPSPGIEGSGDCGPWRSNFSRQNSAESCGMHVLEMLTNTPDMSAIFRQLDISPQNTSIADLAKVLNSLGPGHSFNVYELPPYIQNYNRSINFLDYINNRQNSPFGFVVNTGTHWVLIYVLPRDGDNNATCVWYLDPLKEKPEKSLTPEEANDMLTAIYRRGGTEINAAQLKRYQTFENSFDWVKIREQPSASRPIGRRIPTSRVPQRANPVPEGGGSPPQGSTTSIYAVPEAAEGATRAPQPPEGIYAVPEAATRTARAPQRSEGIYAVAEGGGPQSSSRYSDLTAYSSFAPTTRGTTIGNRPPQPLPSSGGSHVEVSGIPNLPGDASPQAMFRISMRFPPNFETSRGRVFGQATCGKSDDWWKTLKAVCRYGIFHLEDTDGNKFELDDRVNRGMYPKIWYFSNRNTLLVVKPIDRIRFQSTPLEYLDTDCPVLRSKLIEIHSTNSPNRFSHLLVMENATKFDVDGNNKITIFNDVRTYQTQLFYLTGIPELSQVYYTFMGYYINQMIDVALCLYRQKGVLVSDFKMLNFVMSACEKYKVLIIDTDELLWYTDTKAGPATFFFSEARPGATVTAEILMRQALYAIMVTTLRMYAGDAFLWDYTNQMTKNYDHHKQYILDNNFGSDAKGKTYMNTAFAVLDSTDRFDDGLTNLQALAKTLFSQEPSSAAGIGLPAPAVPLAVPASTGPPSGTGFPPLPVPPSGSAAPPAVLGTTTVSAVGAPSGTGTTPSGTTPLLPPTPVPPSGTTPPSSPPAAALTSTERLLADAEARRQARNPPPPGPTWEEQMRAKADLLQRVRLGLA